MMLNIPIIIKPKQFLKKKPFVSSNKRKPILLMSPSDRKWNIGPVGKAIVDPVIFKKLSLNDKRKYLSEVR